MTTKRRNALSWLLLLIPAAIVVLTLSYAVEYRQQGAAAMRREARLLEMLNAEEHAVVIIDDDGVIQDWGKGAERLFGWTDKEVEGGTLDFLMSPTDVAMHHTALAKRKQSSTKEIVTLECWAYHRDGRLIPIRAVVASFSNHKGYWHMAMLTAPDNISARGAFAKPGDGARPAPPNPMHEKK